MRILQAKHFSLDQRNGLNTCVSQVMLGLAERGHDVRLVFGGEPRASDRLLSGTLCLGRLEHYRIRLTEAVQRRLLQRTMTLLEQWHPDVVHAHDARTGATLAPICRERSIPLVLSQHGLLGIEVVAHRLGRENGSYQRWIIQQERIAYHTARKVLVVSSHMVDYVVSFGVPRDNVIVFPNGVDVPTSVSPLGPGATTFVCCGRFEPNKGFDLAIKAIAVLVHQRGHKRARLVIIGDGPGRPELEWIARAESVAQEIMFTGSLPRNEVIRWMAQGLALVVPSVPRGGIIEGFPYVMLEAMSVGRPVIASNLGGLRDAILPGETGFLVTPGDIEELVSAMERFMLDPSLATSMGRRAMELVQMEYSREVFIKRLENVYKIVQRSN